MASLVEAAGNVLDLPASMIRDALVLRNPIDQFLSPLGQDNRTSGNEMLNMLGMEGDSPWLGLGLEMALDPTTYFGWGALSKGAKGYKAASKALKAAGKKAGVRGVASHLLGREAQERLASLQKARSARSTALRDIPLTPLQETQAIAATAAATRATTFDEGLAIINAMPSGPAKDAALANFAELADAQRQVDAVARGAATFKPADARTDLTEAMIRENAIVSPEVRAAVTDRPTGWIGQFGDAIGNTDNARLLDALTEGTTGLPYDISPVPVPAPLRRGANSAAINRARQANAALDVLTNSSRNFAEQPRIIPVRGGDDVSRVGTTTNPATPYATYTREQLLKMDSDIANNMRYEQGIAQGNDLRAGVAQSNVREFERQLAAINQELASRRGGNASTAAATAAPSIDAAMLMSQALVSPGMVDMEDLAKLVNANDSLVAMQAQRTAAAPANVVTHSGAMDAARKKFAAGQSQLAAQTPPASAAPTQAASQSPIVQRDPLDRRLIRGNYGGRDAFARDAYDAAVAAAPIAGRKMLRRRMPTIESLRNATYRDPNFRQVFGGGGAILAADEGRSGNPYDPYAADEMGMEPDELMRAMMAYRGR